MEMREIRRRGSSRGQRGEASPLQSADSAFGITELVRGAGLDLDEGEGGAVPGYDVHLAAAETAVVAGDDAQTGALQKSMG